MRTKLEWIGHKENFMQKGSGKTEWSKDPYMSKIDNLVLVHRLKEVTALIGFTRLNL